MILSEQYRFLFVHIPKTGGTSLTVLLQPYLDPEGPTSGHGWQAKYHNVGRLHDPLTDEIAQRHADYFKFCFVRNPYDWVSSAWRNNIAKTELSFEDYCAALTKDRSQFRHAEPQSWYIHGASGQRLVDFVGRYETYLDDVQTVLQKLGLEKAQIPHRLNTKSRYLPYTEATAAHVFDAYREDFERLGYDKNSWTDVNGSYSA